MNFLDKDLQEYCEAHTQTESTLLKKISRETNTSVYKPRMLSGHLQGRFLSIISRMIAPRFVLDIGTYTGYSAICLTEGLAAGGRVVTLEVNPELEERARRYFAEAGIEDRIDFRVGDALKIIPSLDMVFDLVFLDAGKDDYVRYLDIVLPRVRTGGFILADNVLWSGKVLDERPDRETTSILEFNDRVQKDERIENVLLPLRDGIMMMRKR